jgi:preprotein translocase subunit SecB
MTDVVTADDLARLAGRIGAAAELLSIEMQDLSFSTVPREITTYPIPIALSVNLIIEHSRIPPETVGYRVKAQIDGHLSDGKPLFHLEASYVAAFILRGPDFTEGELDAFGNVSVVQMVFPYLRELTASVSSRSGLPPLTLPAFRVPIGATQSEPVAAPSAP